MNDLGHTPTPFSDHWLLIARRGEGKSTFAAQMTPEYLVADLDGRWNDQSCPGSHVIAESDPLKLMKHMEGMRPDLQGKVGTVIYDSGTAILDFIQSKGRLQAADAKANGGKFNMDEVNKLKADTMRLLRLGALKWHCSVLWIFHIEDNMQGGAKGERTTISKLEMERMKSNLHAALTIVRDPKTQMRGIRVEWCRFNDNKAAGQIVWDTEGKWVGVPQKLSIFLRNYTGVEQYNGNQYSWEWLLNFLKSKGKEFASVEEMRKTVGMRIEPDWFDRASWMCHIKNALEYKKAAAEFLTSERHAA